MTLFDWLLVLGINGAIVAYGVRISKRAKNTFEWFLASRGLPWWLVGPSLFATAVDSGDYVAVVGGAYTFGLSNLTTWWLGLPIGWFLVSFLVLVPVYRSGFFTNAEYLEYRFSPSVRLLSALIQIQYRTNVLGNIAYSLYLMFTIPTGWGPSAWFLVVLVALAAGSYSAAGGLRAVAATDAMQSIFILLAALVLWSALWTSVGGWGGLGERLAAIEPALEREMLHVGGREEPGVPAALVIFGWIAAHLAYVVVNHSQAMRLLAARSERDMRLATVLAACALAAVMWFNITLGVMGRAVYPDLGSPDQVFPRMAMDYLAPGLLGLVVAGVLAGGISTYDSIGSSLAAVFVRDIYARFFVPKADDEHYLRVSRWATLVVLALSFGYVPFLGDGMVALYLRLTSIAVMPLCSVTLMGALSRVHKKSGAVGLVAGILYGLSSFGADRLSLDLPIWWTSPWWAYLWGLTIPATAMVAYSLARGWASPDEIPGLTLGSGANAAIDSGGDTWLERSRREMPAIHDEESEERQVSLIQRPIVWAVVFLAAASWLLFGELW